MDKRPIGEKTRRRGVASRKLDLERKNQKIARRCAAVFVLALALVLFWDRFELLQHGLGSPNWPQVSGEVVEVRSEPMGAGLGGANRKLVIVYRYQVQDSDYISTRERFSRRLQRYSVEAAESVMEQYRPGTNVTVFHHPQDPQVSVLETGVDYTVWMGLVIAFALMVVAVIFWVVPTRLARRDP